MNSSRQIHWHRHVPTTTYGHIEHYSRLVSSCVHFSADVLRAGLWSCGGGWLSCGRFKWGGFSWYLGPFRIKLIQICLEKNWTIEQSSIQQWLLQCSLMSDEGPEIKCHVHIIICPPIIPRTFTVLMSLNCLYLLDYECQGDLSCSCIIIIIEIENLEQPIAVSFYNVNKIMNTPESCGSW